MKYYHSVLSLLCVSRGVKEPAAIIAISAQDIIYFVHYDTVSFSNSDYVETFSI